MIKEELHPIHVKIEDISKKYQELKASIEVFSGKYDTLLNDIKTTNSNFQQQARDIKLIKQDLSIIDKRAVEALDEVEELGQYIRRDCLEISGIQADHNNSAEEIVKAVGEAIGVVVHSDEISIAHQIPTYNPRSPPKVIVKFTHRKTRNKFYEKRKNLFKKKAKDLPNLNISSQANVYISESLTPKRKKLFSEVNKTKKYLKWKYIWSNNGKIYIKKSEKSQTYTFNKIEDLEDFKKDNHLYNDYSAT